MPTNKPSKPMTNRLPSTSTMGFRLAPGHGPDDQHQGHMGDGVGPYPQEGQSVGQEGQQRLKQLKEPGHQQAAH